MPKEKWFKSRLSFFKLSLMVKLNYFFTPKLILIKINKIDVQYFRLRKMNFAMRDLNSDYCWLNNLL